ncbi:hypothetical protein [Bradyrhizobium sp. B120]|uniref:GAP1-N1 domain-containing protein n=1 Tax=Bradyrhizobium sp. B120 TaxID=3410088 RepID=UPI003B98303F
MADELASAFRCQQTLHGYGEGHRLLVGSASLSARDARTMLVLSDAAGGGMLPADGYLTGYPLIEAAKYVVARTWSAPEMPRPGCVWTHSILVDFSDLAAMRSASPILTLLRRPISNARDSYSRDLLVASSTSSDPSISNAQAAGELAGAVYGHPTSKVVAGLDAGYDEDLVVQFWMQQWPKLRRSFRFCTFASNDRSTSSEAFDVQLVSATARIPRMRILNAIVPSRESLDPDLAPIVEDLLEPDAQGLRRFLRVSGGEISGGRGAMRPLARIFAFVYGRSPLSQVSGAIAALEEIGSSQAVTARKSIVERLAQDIESIDEQSFQLVLSQARSHEDFDKSIAEKASGELWRRQPSAFANALSTKDPLTDAIEMKLASMDEDALLAGIEQEPAVAPEIVRWRQDLLRSPRFWSIRGLDTERVLASSTGARPADIVISMIVGGIGHADLAVRKFGANPLIEAIEKVGSELEPTKLDTWLRALTNRSDELNQALSAGMLTFMPLLLILARATYPDAARSGGGIDPWLEAFKRARGTVGREHEDYLKAFLLTRALGWQSGAPSALMKSSVEAVHRALAEGRMPAAGWALLYQRLPWVAPWHEWDRCWRLRQVVVERFVERDLDPVDFANLVDDPILWRELAVSVARSSRGERYLRRVRERLEGTSSETEMHRMAEIDRLLS